MAHNPDVLAPVGSAGMADRRVTITPTDTFDNAHVKRLADSQGLPMTEYVRQSVRLREYLDEHGWTTKCLRNAEALIRAGAWRD